MNYYEYLFGDKQVMDKAPSRDAYVVLCNDVEGTIPRLINAIGKHGNGGHSYEIVLDPDTKEKESFFWDGDGSDRIDGIVKIHKEGDDKDGKIALINMLLHTLDSIKWQADEPVDMESPRFREENEPPMTREQMLQVFKDIQHDAHLCLTGCGYENVERRTLNTILEYCKNDIEYINGGGELGKAISAKDVLEHIKEIAEGALKTKKKK